MNQVIVKQESALGAVLLIAGCCIGAGMIGLPVLSAAAGFMPSTLAMALSYLFTTATGLLLLEATLWFDQRVNLLSIAQYGLGKAGKYLAATLFLFLFYSLFVAYLDGGAQMATSFIAYTLGMAISRAAGLILFLLLVVGTMYCGTRGVVRVNRALMVALATAYVALVIVGLPHVKVENLLLVNWKATLGTLPILFICFGFQNMVPSVTYYLKKNVSALRTTIVLGNLLPFFFYFLWNYVILGMLSVENLQQSQGEEMVVGLLEGSAKGGLVLLFVKAFSFFALFTSFLAIAVSFIDFFRDGLKKSLKGGMGSELLIYALVFLPPALCSLLYPHLFLRALGFAGGVVDVILYGALPAAIVWVGRYVKKAQGPYQVAGGKPFLAVMFFGSLALLALRHYT